MSEVAKYDDVIEAMAKAAYLSVRKFDPDNIWWDENDPEDVRLSDPRLEWPDAVQTWIGADGYRDAAKAAFHALQDVAGISLPAVGRVTILNSRDQFESECG